MNKTYLVTVCRYGFATVEAEDEEDAMMIADGMKAGDFNWSDDTEITNCEEYTDME